MATSRVLLVAMCAVVGSLSVCLAQEWEAGDETDSWVLLQPGLDEDVPRYEMALSLSESRPGQFGRQQAQETCRPLESPEQGYTERVDFALTPLGVQYSLLVRPAREIDWLGRETSSRSAILRVAVLRGDNGEDPKLIEEGYVSTSQSFSLPVEVTAAQFDLPMEQTLRGTVEFRLDASRPDAYRASMTLTMNASLTGSLLLESASVGATIECPGMRRLEDGHIMVQVTPFDKRLRADTALTRLLDIVTLQTSRLVVEKIARDYSRVGLAVVSGRLGQPNPEELVEELQGIMPQNPLPRFSRVDLIRRRLISLDNLCVEAGESGHIVLIFGNHPPEDLYGRSNVRNVAPLSLDEDLIEMTLNANVQNQLVLAFVCDTFDPAMLYDRWLERYPTFYMISDYSQPSYVLPSRAPGTSSGRSGSVSASQVETLRGKFSLPAGKVSVLLADGEGTVLYTEPDAGGKLEQVLTGVNEMIRGLSPTGDLSQDPEPVSRARRGPPIPPTAERLTHRAP